MRRLAEEQNHHPDILIHGWNKVRLTLSTHSEGGLTDADFQLAGRLDPLSEPLPSPGLPTLALATFERPASAMTDDEELPRSSFGPDGPHRTRSRPPGIADALLAAPKALRARVNGIKLIIAALLIAINAFFVIAEYALVRSRRARLELMREEGAKGAALALEQVGNVNEYISAVQIGVTMTSIGIGALGQPALASILKGALRRRVQPRCRGRAVGGASRSC